METLSTAIDREAEKTRTTKATWNLVQRFWASRDEWPQELLIRTRERVRTLENRMASEHGWGR